MLLFLLVRRDASLSNPRSDAPSPNMRHTLDTRRDASASDPRLDASASNTRRAASASDTRRDASASPTRRDPSASDTRRDASASDTRCDASASDTRRAASASETLELPPIPPEDHRSSSICRATTLRRSLFRHRTRILTRATALPPLSGPVLRRPPAGVQNIVGPQTNWPNTSRAHPRPLPWPRA